MQDPRFVDVDGIRTRYFEAGSGPPMVFVHGGSIGSPYNAYHWSLNFDELAKRFHVYALDKLGNGHTDNPTADADYTMAAVIAHVHGFLRTMQIENAVLVGHSRGALPVTRIAIDDPARCSALVILDTNTLAPEDPSTPSDFYRKLEVAPVESNEEYASREPIANSYSTAHMTDDFVQAAADVVALEKTWTALAKMKTLGGSTFQPDVRVQRADTLDMIAAGRLNVPMLIAWGLDDPSAPIKLGMDLLGIVGPALPHVRLHVFNRAGHYAFREHAAEMNRLIAAFVDEVEAR